MTTLKTVHSDVDLIALTPLSPDPARVARTRHRCREALSRNVRRRERLARARAAVAPAIVAACCALYALLLLANTLRVEGLL